MSLINDALQRAREDEVRSQTPSGVPAATVDRSSRSVVPWILFGATLLALVAVVVGLWYPRRSALSPTSPTPPVAAQSAPDPGGVAVAPEGVLAGGASTSTTADAAPQSTTATNADRAIAGTTPSQPTEPTSNRDLPADRSTVPAEAGSPTVETPVQRSSQAATPQARSNRRARAARRAARQQAQSNVGGAAAVAPSPESTTELADGTRVELRGIVWSDENPSALINNSLLGVGETVAGLSVIEITPTEVVLASGVGSEAPIRLRLP